MQGMNAKGTVCFFIIFRELKSFFSIPEEFAERIELNLGKDEML